MLPLDLHAHIRPDIEPRELDLLAACVVGVTRTPREFADVTARRDETIAWGLGAHPSVPAAHEDFDADRFRKLLTEASIVGEVGVDGRSKVASHRQRRTLDSIFATLVENPRVVSVHSLQATTVALDAIEEYGLQGVILHWWRGTEAETRRGLSLGCYFSINAAEVVRPKVLELLPRDRVLTETDHPYGDRREARPRRPGGVAVVEAALSQRWNVDINGVRRQVWANFRRVATQTGTAEMFPPSFQKSMLAA